MGEEAISIVIEIVPHCDPSLVKPLRDSDEILKVAADLQGTAKINELVNDLGLHPDQKVNWSFTISSTEKCTSEKTPVLIHIVELPKPMEPFRARIADAAIDLVDSALGGKNLPGELASNLGYNPEISKFEVGIGSQSLVALSREELAESMNFQCSAPLLFEYSKGCSSWPF